MDGLNGGAAIRQLLMCDNVLRHVTASKLQTGLNACWEMGCREGGECVRSKQ